MQDMCSDLGKFGIIAPEVLGRRVTAEQNIAPETSVTDFGVAPSAFLRAKELGDCFMLKVHNPLQGVDSCLPSQCGVGQHIDMMSLHDSSQHGVITKQPLHDSPWIVPEMAQLGTRMNLDGVTLIARNILRKGAEDIELHRGVGIFPITPQQIMVVIDSALP